MEKEKFQRNPKALYRFFIRVQELKDVPYYRPSPDSPEMRYMREQREELGGLIPVRRSEAQRLETPSLDDFSGQLKGSGKREISTTMAFVRMLSTLVKDKAIGERVIWNARRYSPLNQEKENVRERREHTFS